MVKSGVSSEARTIGLGTQCLSENAHLFYYITLSCNRNCKHCYVGDRMTENGHADLAAVLLNLEEYRNRGMSKVVFLGGEPCIHPELGEILRMAAKLGYEEIVVDTNGTTPLPDFQEGVCFRFGFEGATATHHDAIRGAGAFDVAIQTMRRLNRAGVATEVTYTITRPVVRRLFSELTFFANEAPRAINIHYFSAMGNGRNHGELALDAKTMIASQQTLHRFGAASRVPIRFPIVAPSGDPVVRERLAGFQCRIEHPQAALLMPDGTAYRCPLEIEFGPSKDGLPLCRHVFPKSELQRLGYVFPCISWKAKYGS
jgi:MoaA/NifB/PqqE/SkfB family radical SAM enzyme